MEWPLVKRGLLDFDRDWFDLSPEFEQLLFSIIPSILFNLLAAARIRLLVSRPALVKSQLLHRLKLVSPSRNSSLHALVANIEPKAVVGCLICIDIVLLALNAVGYIPMTGYSLAATTLRLLATMLLLPLSHLDHLKSVRPSILISIYLFFSILLDIARTRTLFLMPHSSEQSTFGAIFAASLGVRLVLFVLEALSKSEKIGWNDDEHSPEETSGVFSLALFAWIGPFMLRGYKKVIDLQDLYPLDMNVQSATMHARFKQHIDYSKLKEDKHALVKAVGKTLISPLTISFCCRMATLGFQFCQPFFISTLTTQLETQASFDAAYSCGYVGAAILIYGGIGIAGGLQRYYHQRAMLMGRSIVVAEIYEQSTQLSLSVEDKSASLTLMSTDVDRTIIGFVSMFEFVASGIQVPVAAYLLYRELGLAFLVPIVIVAICGAGLAGITGITGRTQSMWMAAVQKRVGLTSVTVTNMKTLKISGLAAAVRDYINVLRQKDVHAGGLFNMIYSFNLICGFSPKLIGPPLVFAFAPKELSTATLFTSLSYLVLLAGPLSNLFQFVSPLIAAFTCFGRIQKFLEEGQRVDFRKSLPSAPAQAELVTEDSEGITSEKPSSSTSVDAIKIANGSFSWTEGKPVLKDINVGVPKSSITMVVGPVASGKSSFCKTLLGEIPISEGTTTLYCDATHVGFCDQTPFLFNASIRQNIIGHSPYNDQRYAEVIAAVSLDYDLKTLKNGDMTKIGSDGITLSGGQKQRVSLARALYVQSELIVLDDVLSGLDAETDERLVSQVFGPNGLLRRRACTAVLCTHSVKHLYLADHIIALEDGRISEQGTFEELTSRDGYVHRLGLNLSRSDESSNSASEESTEGKMDLLPYAGPEQSDLQTSLDSSRQGHQKGMYRSYFLGLGWTVCLGTLIGAVIWAVFINLGTVWLTFFPSDFSNPRDRTFYPGIYALIQIIAFIGYLGSSYFISVKGLRRAGRSFHSRAIATLVAAPLSFFTATDSGVITNLFSQDLNLIDDELPGNLFNWITLGLEAIGQVAVMILTSPYIAATLPAIFGLLYAIQVFYLRTSRQVRLLDLEHKSPLYTHFMDTIKGVSTLRAYGFVANDLFKNTVLLDKSQRAKYHLTMIQIWMRLVLEMVVMLMAGTLVAVAVRVNSNAGFAGAGLISLMLFGQTLMYIVRFYTGMEITLGAVSRINTFCTTVLPEDKPGEDTKPPLEWPQAGSIEFQHINASYSSAANTEEKTLLALCDVNLCIKAGERVAICGRTGSGKSSLVSLLLKLLDPLEKNGGSIVVDDVLLADVDRATLRERIIAVPQDVVFLPDGASFYDNLDPYSRSTHSVCEAALVAVGMWTHVKDNGGLEGGLVADNMSAGQKQLLSLARALVRQKVKSEAVKDSSAKVEGGILLLDEVSSNVDRATERMMQDIIRDEFKSYTILAVSHRLEMIMDFDRVVVMEKGEIVEVGNPMALKETAGSRFRDLVLSSGK